MNRTSWKQNYKKVSRNKWKRLSSKLSEGNPLRRINVIKSRRETFEDEN